MTRSVADINAEIRDVACRLGALRAERRIARRREAGITWAVDAPIDGSTP
jgi:hypothetical protein